MTRARFSARPTSAASPAPPASPAAPAREEPSAWNRVVSAVGAVGPPLTVATALLIYFGWARTDAQSRAMGLDVSLFGYTPQDLMLRSIRSLFFPLVCLVMLAIVWLTLDCWLQKRLEAGPARARIAAAARRVALVAALVTLAAWLTAILWPGASVIVIPYTMAASVLACAWGLRMWRLARNPAGGPAAIAHRAVEKTLVGALVTLLLFWGTADFAQAVGRGLAIDTEQRLGQLPRAQVYSRERLAIGTPGVTEVQLGTAEAPLYRYAGLHLLVVSGGRYFLLPDGWRLGSSAVVVLPDNQDVRIEFGG